ncbi:MAG TPA: hypothetical protein VMU55_05335 [Solirubrobacteraceae bacterium]|nr:hypothetical protein [Solirubrobacteraceae bacterium]
MALLRSLLSPTPARPGRRMAEPGQLENLTDEQHSAVLDALEWSDLDSSHDLVRRVDVMLEQLDAWQADRHSQAASPSV